MTSATVKHLESKIRSACLPKAINSQGFAPSRISRQAVNHPSVFRVADVRELAQSSLPIQRETQCQFLFTDTSLFSPTHMLKFLQNAQTFKKKKIRRERERNLVHFTKKVISRDCTGTQNILAFSVKKSKVENGIKGKQLLLRSLLANPALFRSQEIFFFKSGFSGFGFSAKYLC